MRSVTKSRGTASADALPASEKSVSSTVIFSRGLKSNSFSMKCERVFERSADVRDDERLRRVQVDDADVVRLGRGELSKAGRRRARHREKSGKARHQEPDRHFLRVTRGMRRQTQAGSAMRSIALPA